MVLAQIVCAEPSANPLEVRIDRLRNRPVIKRIAPACGNHPVRSCQVRIAAYLVFAGWFAVRLQVGLHRVGRLFNRRAGALKGLHIAVDVVADNLRRRIAGLAGLNRGLEQALPTSASRSARAMPTTHPVRPESKHSPHPPRECGRSRRANARSQAKALLATGPSWPCPSASPHFGSHTNAKQSPPSPLLVGSTNPSTAFAATAASTADPPRFSIAIAVCVASGCAVPAAPFNPSAGDRVAKFAPAGRSPACTSGRMNCSASAG